LVLFHPESLILGFGAVEALAERLQERLVHAFQLLESLLRRAVRIHVTEALVLFPVIVQLNRLVIRLRHGCRASKDLSLERFSRCKKKIS
jgi:hypothetical protein